MNFDKAAAEFITLERGDWRDFASNPDTVILSANLSDAESMSELLPYDSKASNLVVVKRSQPWDAYDDESELTQILALQQQPGLVARRLVVMSACGFGPGNIWHDGALAHISAQGTVLSYIPAGGAARLTIPLHLKNQVSKKTTPRITHPTQRALRCLTAAFGTQLAFQPTGTQWQLDDFSLHAAVGLTLMRMSAPERPIEVWVTAAPPVNWRRLAQHLNVELKIKTAVSPAVEALSAMTALIPVQSTLNLALQINRHGAVIPDSMLTENSSI